MANGTYCKHYSESTDHNDWFTRLISSMLDSYERTSLCSIFTTVICCFTLTMMSVLMVGVGIGFHYCPLDNNLGLNMTAVQKSNMFNNNKSPTKYTGNNSYVQYNNVLENNVTSGISMNDSATMNVVKLLPGSNMTTANIEDSSNELGLNTRNRMILQRDGSFLNTTNTNNKDNKNVTASKNIIFKSNRSIFKSPDARSTTPNIPRYGTHWYLKKMAITMGCIATSLAKFISTCLDSCERISLCTICAALVCCIMLTIMTVMIIGIGIGFHYCSVSSGTGKAEGKETFKSIGRRSLSGEDNAISNVIRAHRVRRAASDNVFPNNNSEENKKIEENNNSTNILSFIGNYTLA